MVVVILGVWPLFQGKMTAEESSPGVIVGAFSKGTMEGWEPKEFESRTLYRIAQVDGRSALEAVSRASASGLVKQIRVDLEKYPYINWQWRIENRLAGSFDERQKSGDDYAARIYVIASGGIAIWNTRALNYVWARHEEKGSVWNNAYAGKRAVMKAVRSGGDPVSVWQSEKRNIKKDLETRFGRKIRYIDAVALMSDTDNTGKSVTAFYGDIYFTAE